MILNLLCIGALTGMYALICRISLSLHVKKMAEAIAREPFALKNITRREASARLLEWQAEKKRILPAAMKFAALLCALDLLVSLTR